MKPEPQWHNFPFKTGIYALRDGHYISFARIADIDGKWYFRNDGHAYSYPFDPSLFDGKCYGPIELPKLTK